MDNALTNEHFRLQSLCQLGILDTPAEQRFDQFTVLAATAFGVPIALVSLVDRDRQWFKSRVGVDASETERSLAFCSHAIECHETLIVADTLHDARFADHPFVLGEPHIRFYAGHPIRSHDGHAVGTLCIADTAPRTLSDAQITMLHTLAKLVEHELNRDSVVRARNDAENALHALNATLDGRVRERTLALQEKNDALSREIRQRTEVEASLRRSEELLDAVLDTVDMGVIACDAGGDLTFFNRAAGEFHGQGAGQVAVSDWADQYDLYEADGKTRMAPSHIPLLRALAGDSVRDARMVIAPRGMKRRTVLASGRRMLSASGERLGAVVALKDLSDLDEWQEKLHSSEQMLRTITDNVPVLISYLDSEFRFQFANAIYKEWLGKSNAAMIGNTVEEVFGAAYFEERKPGLLQALAGNMTNIEVTVHRKGHERILSTTYMPHHRDGNVVGIYVLATDSTASREHERQLLALANADPLTNLPNRRMYEFHLDKALALSRRQGTRLGLMYLDLDNFKKINDTLGHSAGDAVLIEFGKRVKSTLRESDMLARLAGDEFTVLLEGVANIEDCEAVAKKVLDVLKKPFSVCGQSVLVSASIGVALGGADATADKLTHEADAALYSSKRKGKSQFCVIALAAKPGQWREARAAAQ
ncbi:MAG: diguanylate cyclase [Telluria sp.]